MVGNVTGEIPQGGSNSPSKYAIRKLVRGEDGLMKIIYVDAKTGEQLNSLEGYVVYSAHEAQQQGIGVTSPDDLAKDNSDGQNNETTAKKIKRDVASDEGSDQERVSGRNGGGLGGFLDRSPGNNYGYIDAPNWLSLAGFAPVVGPYVKMADRAIGVNNTVAANKARETIGLNPLGGIRSLGNILGFRDESTAANVEIGETPYSVGFEALNAKGQTTLTPNEARQRALVTGRPLTEMTPAQSRVWEKDFEYPKNSLLGGVAKTIGSFFNSTGDVTESDIISYHNPNYDYLGDSGSQTYTRASNVPDSAIPTPASRPSSDSGLGGSGGDSSSSSGSGYDANEAAASEFSGLW